MNKLLTYYGNMRPNSEMTFTQLGRKIAVLFTLLENERKQVFFTIHITNVIFQTEKAILLPNKTLKYTSPKHPIEYFVYHSFSENETLCIAYCLKLSIKILSSKEWTDVRVDP